MAFGSFQAFCSLSTPAFDMKTQASYSSHPQNPIQGPGHWDQPGPITKDWKNSNKPVTCKLVTSDLIFPTVTITNGAAQEELG